jgi:hypothetical protein
MPIAKSRSTSELSSVELRHPVECKVGMLPEGARGTVVHVYRDGEFPEPFRCTVTLMGDDIQPA